MEKKLGKISNIEFGLGGYNDACIGMTLTFEGIGFGCVHFESGGWSNTLIEHTEYCKWTEDDRAKQQSLLIQKIDKLLSEAKICNINDLKNQPVELTFDDSRTLKSWRLLTAVL